MAEKNLVCELSEAAAAGDPVVAALDGILRSGSRGDMGSELLDLLAERIDRQYIQRPVDRNGMPMSKMTAIAGKVVWNFTVDEYGDWVAYDICGEPIADGCNWSYDGLFYGVTTNMAVRKAIEELDDAVREGWITDLEVINDCLSAIRRRMIYA